LDIDARSNMYNEVGTKYFESEFEAVGKPNN
jgi:hypothetical protein